MNLEEEEHALGPWPRRLLCVSNLTSYAWQPGNVYNGVKEPQYNAITYTWGRWRLKDGEQPDTKSIPISINGDDWTIPRVDPKHFTTAEFENVIRATTTLQPNFRSPNNVEFVWLDIACIHQGDDPRSAAEIGRQAAIFHGAKAVFLWLTTHSHRSLERAVDDIWAFYGGDVSEHTPLHSRSLRNLRGLLNDPWFTSLWTLQEAFLRHDAYVLSRDAQLVYRLAMTEPPIRLHVCSLYDLLFPCAFWKDASEHVTSRRSESVELEYQAAFRLIESRGLDALYSRHELNTYIAANSRTVSHEEDRIYGIQQVFGLRLGKSNPSQSHQSPDRHDLEAEFGEQLLLQFPIQSQMHVFTENVPVALRWRVHPCSRKLGKEAFSAPRMLEECFYQGKDSSISVCCRFSIEELDTLDRPVSWTGYTIPFRLLNDRWNAICRKIYSIQFRDIDDEGVYNVESPYPLFVELDAVEETAEYHCTRGKAGFETEGADLKKDTNAIGWLVQRYRDDELRVLLLGFCWSLRTTVRYQDGMYGIILLSVGSHWARVGICQWSHQFDWTSLHLGLTEDEQDFLRGSGKDWVDGKGVLGYSNRVPHGSPRMGVVS